MRKRVLLVLGVTALAMFAAQGMAAPKRKAPKEPPTPVPQWVAPSAASSFITYDLGALTMTGKSLRDLTFSVGTLQLNGRNGGSTIYNVGTLTMSGSAEH